MNNKEVAQLLYGIADLLELKGEMIFKVVAYRRAAQNIENFSKPVEDLWKENTLNTIPGVGKGIAEHIDEFLRTGKSEYLEKMKKKMPMDFESLMNIEGLGPKKVKMLYDKLKIKTVKDLESAAKAGKIRKLAGMGEKTEQNILKGIEFSKKAKQRMLLGVALPMAEHIINNLRKLGYVHKAEYAGSLRRKKETIGDIDILVTSSQPNKVINHFTKMPGVADVIVKGPTKVSVHYNNIQVDLRVLKENEYGSALLYFTGSKEHNIELRKVAIAKKLKLSEYGLFRGNKMIAGCTEEEVYKALGMQYIEPEMREEHGEIRLAQKHSLPKIISYSDVVADLHMHTKWSDGLNTIEEMALAAKQLGYDYICITDHVGKLKIASALSEKDIDKQRKEIEKVQDKTGIHILHGAEIDIRVDGRFDVSNEALKKFDLVFAALHSALKGPIERNTQRIIKAMENPNVDIIAHPTGRLIDRREGATLDIQKIIKKSLETNTVMEINSQPNRLDLNDVNAKAALEDGCKLVINTDAHSADPLKAMKLGVAVARRAWTQKKDILNTLSYKEFCKHFGISC
ncbi:MAG: DNA polymerase/3'-5' exonuclease PolX [Candidatus Aenigmarchaeota archaeon]|nr:DNA polymerase/3'-5' exonuclease PolX [Candidatus Aenigmarchaeota archaeon]